MWRSRVFVCQPPESIRHEWSICTYYNKLYEAILQPRCRRQAPCLGTSDDLNVIDPKSFLLVLWGFDLVRVLAATIFGALGTSEALLLALIPNLKPLNVCEVALLSGETFTFSIMLANSKSNRLVNVAISFYITAHATRLSWRGWQRDQQRSWIAITGYLLLQGLGLGIKGAPIGTMYSWRKGHSSPTWQPSAEL
jgi:hypothetical protein